MNAYPTLRLLLSASLLALTACGTSILGGGGPGGDGTGGSGAGGSGTGNGTTGTGGSCTPTPGDHSISTSGYSVACTQDSDCVVVYAGNLCDVCTCPNAVIAASGQAAYQQEEATKEAGCCPAGPEPCECPLIAVPVCQQGTCVAGTVTDLCGGKPSPVSCTSSSCPAGYTCTPDPDPTTCHPSSCSCVNDGWVCSADCGMNGSTCYKGI